MKTSKIVLLLAATTIAANVYAANNELKLPDKCTAFRPSDLQAQILFEDVAKKLAYSKDFGQNSRIPESAKDYWVVYSDRDNNATYADCYGSKPYGTLGFNEKVKIAEIKNGYAFVYSDPKEQGTYPDISSYAEVKGWVPMSKLLLWGSGLADRTGIYQKALLCANVDEDLSNGSLGKLFLNPDEKNKFTEFSLDFRFYFVMKKEGKMVLLATQNSFDAKSEKILYGWVDSNSFVSWNQRSCLEPTWDRPSVEYFAGKNIKANIYDDKDCGNKASSWNFNVTDKPFGPNMYRIDGNILRFPILDDSKGDVWNCTSVSFTGSRTGDINPGPDDFNDASLVESQLDNLSRIKIGIVIDGTKSMEKFYPAVKSAVKEFASFFSEKENVEVGVLIYRDIQDGNYATEILRMTNPDNPNLSRFLDTGGEYGIKSSPRDKSLEEALFYGIDCALDSFGFKKEESNMLFVIGDCGNSSDYPSVTREGLIEKLIEKNVTLMGFQVRNDSSVPAYTVFNSNVTDLIKTSLQGRFDKLSSSGARVVVKAERQQNAWEFVNNASSIENSLYVGTHKFVQSGIMDVDVLKDQLIQSVVSVRNTIEYQKGLLADSGKGIIPIVDPNSTTVAPHIELEWLRKRLGDKYIERMNNSAVGFKGYTPKKHKGSGREFYKTCIFITDVEFQMLIQRLNPLYEEAMRKGNDRVPYAKAMKALLQSMIPNISDEAISKYGVDQIMGMISGLNVQTRTTQGYTIPQIMDNKVVNETEYQDIINKFRRSFERLTNLKNTPYPYSFEVNGAKYYWIPTEDLP